MTVNTNTRKLEVSDLVYFDPFQTETPCHVQSQTLIPYGRDLIIRNLESLPRGIGSRAKYLECIRSHTGELVAKAWRKAMPKSFEVLVVF